MGEEKGEQLQTTAPTQLASLPTGYASLCFAIPHLGEHEMGEEKAEAFYPIHASIS